MSNIDLASEMAAARKRREEQTARALREARVLAVRTVVRPGATMTDIEDVARSFYPRLAPEALKEVTDLVFEWHRGRSPLPAAAVELEPELEAEVVEVAEPEEELDELHDRA